MLMHGDEVFWQGRSSALSGLGGCRTRSLEYTEYLVSCRAGQPVFRRISQMRCSHTRDDLDLGDTVRIPQDDADL